MVWWLCYQQEPWLRHLYGLWAGLEETPHVITSLIGYNPSIYYLVGIYTFLKRTNIMIGFLFTKKIQKTEF